MIVYGFIRFSRLFIAEEKVPRVKKEKIVIGG
jgi:hypothetical protein